MSDQLEHGLDVINAVDMEPGRQYLNAAGKIRVRVKEKVDGVVWVEAWSQVHKEWRKVSVDETYKVRLPTKGEMTMVEAAEAEVQKKVAKVKAEKAPSTLGRGKVRNLKMLATWGKVYEEVGANGLEAVKEAMLAEFPEKAESIERWAPAYRIYYNTGRLPGVEKPEQPLVWETAKSAEKEAAKAAKAQAKADAKAEKDRVKAEEKAAKIAAKAAAAQQAADAQSAAPEPEQAA